MVVLCLFVVVVIGKYTQRMVIPVLCLGLLLLSSVSTHNAWSYRYYGWVYRCCRQSVNIISGGIMFGFVVVVIGKYTQRMVIPVLWLGLSLLSSVSKHNKWWYYVWVCCCCHR